MKLMSVSDRFLENIYFKRNSQGQRERSVERMLRMTTPEENWNTIDTIANIEVMIKKIEQRLSAIESASIKVKK